MSRLGFLAFLSGALLAGGVANAQSALNPVPPISASGLPANDDAQDWLRDWYAKRDLIVRANPNLPHDPTSVLVQFAPGTPQAAKNATLALVGGRTIKTWALVPDLHHVAVSMPAGDALKILDAARHQFGVIVFAEPDHLARIGVNPNDTFYSLLWGMNNTGQTVNNDRGTANADIDANLAWDVTTGGAFAVGIADSGIRATHEDLAANRWTNAAEIAGNGIDDDGNGYIDDTWGWDFWNNDSNPTDDNGHGSHVSGTVGAVGNNAKGVVGVCWTVRLVGLKIGSASGSVSVSAAISALDYCVGKGIKLSNHSWSGGAFSSSLNSAITNARTAGHMLVCAAGNGGADGRGDNNNTIPQYPASYTQDNIIAVAALDNDNKLARFSNYGSTSVDLGAPGVTIASCYHSADNAYVYMDGTSMAAPHVTGAAALVWNHNPTWTYAQVRSKIFSTVKPVTALSGKCVTGGCLNVNNAVR